MHNAVGCNVPAVYKIINTKYAQMSTHSWTLDTNVLRKMAKECLGVCVLQAGVLFSSCVSKGRLVLCGDRCWYLINYCVLFYLNLKIFQKFKQFYPPRMFLFHIFTVTYIWIQFVGCWKWLVYSVKRRQCEQFYCSVQDINNLEAGFIIKGYTSFIQQNVLKMHIFFYKEFACWNSSSVRQKG
jgi:hypothetical protein